MYGISWFYLYGVGGLIYGGGTYALWRAGALDFRDPRERRGFWLTTASFLTYAVGHGLFQFVLPFVG